MSDQRIDDRTHHTTPATAPQPISLPNEPYYQQPTQQKQNRRATLGMVLLLIGVLWLGLQFSGFNGLFGLNSHRGTLYDETLTGSRLELDIGSGDVELRAWNNDGIQVRAIQEGGTRDAYAVDVSQSGDTVRVTHAEQDSFCLFCNNGIRYEIAVPAGLETSIQTASGEIEVDGTAGAVTLTSASGDIEARNISNNLTITTASGTVALQDATGDLAVQTISGDIEIEDAAGTFDLETTSGEIRVRDGRGTQLTASSISGDVEYRGELLSEELNTISTTSGEVQLELSDTSDLRVDATTTSGEINSDFDLTNTADDTATLKIETISGDITINER